MAHDGSCCFGGNEHWELASDLARRTTGHGEALPKWAKTKGTDYRIRFEHTLLARLGSYPVYVRAVSAKAKSIRAAFPAMVGRLQLSRHVRAIDKTGKPYLAFGPFVKERIVGFEQGVFKVEREPVSFEIHERQGIMLVFVCDYLMRLHRAVLAVLRVERPHLQCVDWQLVPNKFPGDLAGPMASLFHAIMSGAMLAGLVEGNMRVMTLRHSHEDHGSRLADNIAGMLGEKASRDDFTFVCPNQTAAFWWERWDSALP